MTEQTSPPDETEEAQLEGIKQRLAELQDINKALDKIDKDRFELIQRRLTDEVKERVRPALFKYYAVIGSIVIALLGLVGWDYKAEIKTAVINDISQELQEKRDEIEESVITTDILAKRAYKTIDDVDTKLPKLQAKIATIDENQKKINNLDKKIDDNKNANKENFGNTRDNIEETQKLSKQLEALIDELVRLKEDLNRAGIKNRLNIKTAITQKLDTNKVKATVYFQFAGGSRQKAKTLSQKLQEEGYIVPGEERTPEAAGKSEVRYFYSEDRKKAQTLVNSLNTQNFRVGYRKPVKLSDDFVNYKKQKPPQGTIELWLEIN